MADLTRRAALTTAGAAALATVLPAGPAAPEYFGIAKVGDTAIRGFLSIEELEKAIRAARAARIEPFEFEGELYYKIPLV